MRGVWLVAIGLSAAFHVWFVFGFHFPTRKATALEVTPPPRPARTPIPPELTPMLELPPSATAATAASTPSLPDIPRINSLLPQRLDMPALDPGGAPFTQIVAASAALPDDYKERLDLEPPAPLHAPEGVYGVVYESDDVDRVPMPIHRPSPKLKEPTQRAIAGRSVVARFIVNTDGEPRDIKIVRCEIPDAAKPTIEALEKWRFVPGRKNGETVNTRVEQELRFPDYNPFRI